MFLRIATFILHKSNQKVLFNVHLCIESNYSHKRRSSARFPNYFTFSNCLYSGLFQYLVGSQTMLDRISCPSSLINSDTSRTPSPICGGLSHTSYFNERIDFKCSSGLVTAQWWSTVLFFLCKISDKLLEVVIVNTLEVVDKIVMVYILNWAPRLSNRVHI